MQKQIHSKRLGKLDTKEARLGLRSIPKDWEELDAGFFSRAAQVVAEDLLGVVLLRRFEKTWIGGPIVETEAYTEDDEASHSFKGERPHTKSMFGEPGTLYVYRSYGVHWCLNFSTGRKGQGEAVLIRAVSATFGLEKMQAGASPLPAKLGSGPGRLCAALHIDKDLDGQALGKMGEISLWRTHLKEDFEKAVGTRIGISKAVDRHWRYGIRAHPSLSKKF